MSKAEMTAFYLIKAAVCLYARQQGVRLNNNTPLPLPFRVALWQGRSSAPQGSMTILDVLNRLMRLNWALCNFHKLVARISKNVIQQLKIKAVGTEKWPVARVRPSSQVDRVKISALPP
ncbi:MAG: hypothetical protein U5K75_04930 [Ahrensia sp.]|nr:hypothetical protein [Ahrensia sp.]